MPTTKPTGDAARRASRTAVQVSLVTGLVAAWNLFAPRPLTTEQTAFIMTAGPVLVSYLQNLAEEGHLLPEMLKRPTAPAPPATDLDDRKLEALAAAIGGQHNDIERLENALLDLRADRRPTEPEDEARISTRQAVGAPWPPGGFG